MSELENKELIKKVYAAFSTAAVSGTYHGKPEVMEYMGRDAEVFTIRDGKTVRGEMHGDTALLERVFGKKQLASG